jgi:hypothetical protein
MRLLGKGQRHFGSGDTDSEAIRLTLPDITPHTIRVKKVRERERALEALVGAMRHRQPTTRARNDDVHAVALVEQPMLHMTRYSALTSAISRAGARIASQGDA